MAEPKYVKKVIKKIKDQNAVSLQKIINDKTTKSMEDAEKQLKSRIRELEERIVDDWWETKSIENRDGCNDMSLFNEYNATKDALTILYGVWKESDRQVAEKIKQLMQNERAK